MRGQTEEGKTAELLLEVVSLGRGPQEQACLALFIPRDFVLMLLVIELGLEDWLHEHLLLHSRCSWQSHNASFGLFGSSLAA